MADPAPSALDRLLQEMQAGSDFPALSRTISEINHAVGDENSRANVLTDIILRDIALTKKLLRLVNAARYGAQPVSTVSRAVVILGFDAVRDAAVALMLFEHLRNRAHADQLMGEAVDSFYRGILARRLAAAAGVRDGEEAFISALFRDLGRLMARFHFFERSEEVRRLMADELLDEEAAAERVFGVSYDRIGLAIARHWHFPANILHAMTPLDEASVKAANSESGRLRIVANLARDLHQSLAGKRPEDQEQAVEGIYQRYREAVRISRESLVEHARRATEALREAAMVAPADIGKSTSLPLLPHADAGAAEGETADAADVQEEAHGAGDPAEILALGMQDLTAMMLGSYHIADVFKTVVEILFRSELFDHVLACVLDRASQTLTGRVGLGRDATALRSIFRIPLHFTPDVFHAATAKGQDILISDTTADNIRTRIPDWYRQTVHAHSFLLLPVMLDGKPLALLYADRVEAALQLPGQALGLIKALRNQTALALRQKL